LSVTCRPSVWYDLRPNGRWESAFVELVMASRYSQSGCAM